MTDTSTDAPKRPNMLEIVRNDEMFVAPLNDFVTKLRSGLARREKDKTDQTGAPWVPWIALPEFSQLILRHELQSVADTITPSHQSMFVRELCQSQGLFVFARRRIGGRPTTSVFLNKGAYQRFFLTRPPARTGRSPDHAKYDNERELIPTIRSDGNLVLSPKPL